MATNPGVCGRGAAIASGRWNRRVGFGEEHAGARSRREVDPFGPLKQSSGAHRNNAHRNNERDFTSQTVRVVRWVCGGRVRRRPVDGV